MGANLISDKLRNQQQLVKQMEKGFLRCLLVMEIRHSGELCAVG